MPTLELVSEHYGSEYGQIHRLGNMTEGLVVDGDHDEEYCSESEDEGEYARRSVDLSRVLSELQLEDDLRELRADLRDSTGFEQGPENADVGQTSMLFHPTSRCTTPDTNIRRPSSPSVSDMRDVVETHTALSGI